MYVCLGIIEKMRRRSHVGWHLWSTARVHRMQTRRGLDAPRRCTHRSQLPRHAPPRSDGTSHGETPFVLSKRVIVTPRVYRRRRSRRILCLLAADTHAHESRGPGPFWGSTTPRNRGWSESPSKTVLHKLRKDIRFQYKDCDTKSKTEKGITQKQIWLNTDFINQSKRKKLFNYSLNDCITILELNWFNDFLFYETGKIFQLLLRL